MQRKSHRHPLNRLFSCQLGLLVALLASQWNPALAQDSFRLTSGSGTLVNEHARETVAANLDTDKISGSFSIQVAPEDVGKLAGLYAVANVDDAWYYRGAQGWTAWDGQLSSLRPFVNGLLSVQTEVDLFSQQTLPSGAYRIYVAYRVAQEAIVAVERSLDFSVAASSAASLHPFASDAAMENYIKQGLQLSASENSDVFLLPTLLSVAETADSGARVSTTNLQEVGVDEADIIKTDGEALFVMRNCGRQTCIASFALDVAAASAEEVGSYTLSAGNQADGMYLVENEAGTAETLVSIAGKNQYLRWFDLWGWGNGSTEIEFINANDPAALQRSETLTIEGALVSSRRIGNLLYIVTRHTPSIAGFQPYPGDEESKSANEALLATASLSDLLPTVATSTQKGLPLVSSDRCYVPTNAVEQGSNPSLISITAIPLDNPSAFSSSCYLGNSEALYMTTKALYLATTHNDYSFSGVNSLIYAPEHRTSVHKFSLADTGMEYRGSGTVDGHLGWSEDKRSFRMGENGDYLNIVTSVGDTWNASSSTTLTVLKQGADSLEPVKSIENIGKPGERLYAARFVGERAYLVTFRVIDPLFVLDLSNPEEPRIAGELEIEGYSDYLHPVGDKLLLGIGKDAIADEQSVDFGGGRGAWYQGVKLALFDVSDPAAPKELNSLVYGKRGSESEVLSDHHAFAFLPGNGETLPRFSIPIQVNETAPSFEGFDPSLASSWYSFTSKGLHSFEVSESGLIPAGIISGSEPQLGISPFSFYGDRSVLAGDSVFYVHQGDVLTSTWGEAK